MLRQGGCKVCVTGGGGYIGSDLVHSLLLNGYIVHATLRNLGTLSMILVSCLFIFYVWVSLLYA